MAILSSLKVGLSSGSYCQQEFISRKREAGHSRGRARRSPFSIRLITPSFLMPTKGLTPLIKISQQHTPNIHTSLRPVNRRKLMLSGAIHLMGSLPLDAAKEGVGGYHMMDGTMIILCVLVTKLNVLYHTHIAIIESKYLAISLQS